MQVAGLQTALAQEQRARQGEQEAAANELESSKAAHAAELNELHMRCQNADVRIKESEAQVLLRSPCAACCP